MRYTLAHPVSGVDTFWEIVDSRKDANIASFRSDCPFAEKTAKGCLEKLNAGEGAQR